MISILRKEINTFFAATAGYLVIGIFLILNGLFLWIFKGQFNIPNSGFADLSPFFQLAPWILLFLIPAITMRTFSEEKKQGTLELLLTKPLSNLQIVLGKYLGVLVVIIIALTPTLLYVLAIYQLGNPVGNLDVGSTVGSYIALVLLAAAHIGVGIFCSTLTSNQIVAFLLALLGSFILYFGFGGMASYGFLGTLDYSLQQLGMQWHYDRISRGVIDTQNVCYFIGVIAFFIVLTIVQLQKKDRSQQLKSVLIAAGGIVVFNLLGGQLTKRIDFTKDQRYTLSPATVALAEEVPATLAIELLLKGDFPAEFTKLQVETKQLLDELNAINPSIQYVFTNPLEEEEFRAETLEELQRYGLIPMEVSVQDAGKTEIEMVVPWAIMTFENRSVKIPLIKNKMGATSEERVHQSIQQLEYTFADGLKKLLQPKKYKIAVLKGNGQLPDKYIADFVKTLQEYYFMGAFTLDSVAANPQKTLKELQEFDLFINAKPTETFTEKEKYVLDQFIMNGGKSLWLVEPVAMELDSLFTPEGMAVATVRDLKLEDALFSYGVRINPVLVNDLYSAPLVLATGQGENTKFTPYPWFYSSLTNTQSNHPIVKNIESVKFEFSNQIDTLKNKVKKTILLTSSEKTKLE